MMRVILPLYCRALALRLTALILILATTWDADVLAVEPRVELLWPAGAPGAVGDEEPDRPTLTVYSPPEGQSNGAGIVICPGGGYGHLAVDHEGRQIAEWMNSLGVTAGVLRYRIAPRYHHPAPMQDAKRAIRLMRYVLREAKFEGKKVGLIGFSAGGHLASFVASNYDAPNHPMSEDPVENEFTRPDFLILCYPVITMASPLTHEGSRRNLLGDNPGEDDIKAMSSDVWVNLGTPPTFLMHTTEDTAVPPENSLLFYAALRKAGVPAELHIYEKGPHGVGLARYIPGVGEWPKQCESWLRLREIIPKAP